MNCEGITKGIVEIRKILKSLESYFNSRQIADALHDKKEIYSKSEYLLEETEPDQIRKRDRIAKELGLSWLDKFSEGLAWGREQHEKMVSLVNENAEIVLHFSDETIPAIYAKPFKNGLAWVQYVGIRGPLPKWSIIDSSGKLGRDWYAQVEFSDSGIYLAKKNDTLKNKWSLVKHDGEKIIVDGEDSFFFATSFNDNRAWVQIEENGPYKLIDESGNMLHQGKYLKVKPFSEGYSFVQVKERGFAPFWQCFDQQGNLLPQYWFGGEDLHRLSEGIIRREYKHVTGNNRFFSYATLANAGLDDLNKGKSEDEAEYFEEAGDFSCGFAAVGSRVEGNPIKYYFINKAGEQAFLETYLSITDFSEGAAAVQIDLDDVDNRFGGWTYINTEGKPLFSGEGIDGAKHFYKARPYQDGMACVQDQPDSEPYYINKKGQKVFA